MMAVGLNSAVDAQIIKVIALKKKAFHNNAVYNLPIVRDQCCYYNSR